MPRKRDADPPKGEDQIIDELGMEGRFLQRALRKALKLPRSIAAAVPYPTDRE